MGDAPSTILHTIGHSTRSFDDFLTLLKREAIAQLVDVRRFPMSRRHPQFNRAALERELPLHGIAYEHLEALGGRREEGGKLPATGWRVAAFNAYAHHMRSEAFRRALDRVLSLAARHPTVVMCAEAVPWRCHRTLISDAAVARGCDVRHILDAATRPHELTSFATIVDGDVEYGPARQSQMSMFADEAASVDRGRPRRARGASRDK